MEVRLRRIEIGIGGGRQALAQFARTWRRAARGERLADATPRLEFSSLAELLGALTPKRLALLDVLAAQSRSSIRALAGRLGRDYKNVHGDVCVLMELGLIERRADGTLKAPFDELVIHAPLTAAARGRAA